MKIRTTKQFLECIERNTPEGLHWALGDSENGNEFSWRYCDCCGSELGGSRHEAFLIDSKRPALVSGPMGICSDCLFFHANGDLPEHLIGPNDLAPCDNCNEDQSLEEYPGGDLLCPSCTENAEEHQEDMHRHL